jgi:hypothetical protein
MAQIFHARFGLLVKLSLLAAIVLIATALLLWRSAIAMPHGPGRFVEQAVPFSHKHHVSDDGIDCRYCHVSVEISAFAGIPSIETCMTCHSQLYTQEPMFAPLVQSWTDGRPLHWKRVHDLPGFVYFNHSIHVNKGVGCETCHGHVENMALTGRTQSLEMQWCLDCHRHPEKYLRPREEVFNMAWQPPADREVLGRELMQRYGVDPSKLTDCSVCHR